MPKGIFTRTESHLEKCRENGKTQIGKLPINSKYKERMEIGYLKLLKRTPIGKKPVIWTCECVCGKIINKSAASLAHKDTLKHCGCRKKKSRPANFKGYEAITGAYWGRVKRNAKLRNLEFNITIEDCWELFIKQNKKCALSGLRIFFDGERKGIASLDRIDSNKGYNMSNVQWVHKDVNKIKINLDEEYFIHLCSLISQTVQS